MKMRKKLAALLAAAMIASVMPMTAFAASTNRVDKVVTVKEDITGNYPQLKIELKDTLKAGDRFYLVLENAEWNVDAITTGVAVGLNYSFTKPSKKELEVVVGSEMSATDIITIDLKAKKVKGEATVTIDPSGTTVTAGKYVFAKSDDSEAVVKVEDAKTFVDAAEIAKISFEESYPGAFNKNEKQTVSVYLDDRDFSFTTVGKLVGKRGFTGKDYNGTKISDQEVQFEIPADVLINLQKGLFEIEGLTVKADRKASEGDVTAYVSAPFVKNATVTVAKFGDYSTKLTTSKVEEFTAGTKKTVKFNLEQVGAAITGSRSAIFTFSKDIEIVSVEKAGKSAAAATILEDKDGKKTNEFEIEKFADVLKDADSKVEFEVEINIPAKFKGDLLVTAEGRALEGIKEVKLAEVKAPVTVEVEAMKVEVGTKSNKGGKITIKETDKGNINRGKLVIQLDKDLIDDGVEFTAVKDLVLNTTGGIKVDKAKYIASTSAIEIDVTRQSSEAGSIEISGFEVKARRTIADGAYEIKVGGKALSNIAEVEDKDINAKGEYKKLDAITSADFLLVGNVYGRAEVVFNINSEKFTVNGKEMTMDAAAYIENGRTMVPLRYLSYALGIDEESIKFNSGIVTIFAADGKVIQVQSGNKNLAVNGMTIPMVAAATIVEGRTYVPVTEIGGVFGVTGTWDAVSQTATFK